MIQLKNNPVVNKYAMALFNIAFDSGITIEVLTGMLKIRTAMEENPSFMGFILNPEIDDKRKEEIINKVLGGTDKNGLVMDFFRMTAKKGRLELFSEMAGAYHELVKSSEGEVNIMVHTPFELTEAQKKNISQRVKTVKGLGKVSISQQIRKDLIGGVRLEIMGKIYDGSIAGSLSKIENRLKGE